MSTIKLYKNLSDPREVSKQIVSEAVYNFTPRGPFSATGGVARIQSETNLSEYNYAYIEDFGRYYFITSITAERADLWSFTLRTDVLMTYADDIRALTGTVDRQEHLRNGYLQDAQYQAKQYRQITTKAFPNSMNNDTIILMTVG